MLQTISELKRELDKKRPLPAETVQNLREDFFDQISKIKEIFLKFSCYYLIKK